MKKKVGAEVFKDVKFMSAKEKELVLRSWKMFIQHGMQEKHFTKRLYHHLIQHASFIAHYDKRGFYGFYFGFGNEEKTREFLRQFNRGFGGKSVEYGVYSYWLDDRDYADINNAMCEIIEVYETEFDRKLKGDIRKRDIALAKSLLAKHGLGCELIY